MCNKILNTIKTFFLDLFSGIKNPSPYLAFDMATIITEILLFDKLVRGFTTIWLDTYFYVYLLLCFSIFLKRFDFKYLKGLEWIKRPGVSSLRPFMVLFIYLLSPVIGGFAIGSALKILDIKGVAPAYIGIPLFIICLSLYPLTFYFFAERKAKLEYLNNMKIGRIGTFIVRFISGMGIYLTSLYFLSFVYYNVNKLYHEEISWALRPVILLTVILLFFLIYMPVRIHYFIDNPEDKGNRAWFIFTIISLAIFAVTGRHLF